jgi:hypothetical protein
MLAQPPSTLEALGTDLTERARRGLVGPIVGRDAEVERVIQVLTRRARNNPMLLGEPGVGRTAILEGLAVRIASGAVPEGLRGRRVVALDVPSLAHGPNQPEDRFRALLSETRRPGTSSSLPRTSTPWSGPKASTSVPCSRRPSPAPRSSSSQRARSRTTASTSNRTAPWIGASSRSSSTPCRALEETVEVLRVLGPPGEGLAALAAGVAR